MCRQSCCRAHPCVMVGQQRSRHIAAAESCDRSWPCHPLELSVLQFLRLASLFRKADHFLQIWVQWWGNTGAGTLLQLKICDKAVIWQDTREVPVASPEGCEFNRGSLQHRSLQIRVQWWGDTGAGTLLQLQSDSGTTAARFPIRCSTGCACQIAFHQLMSVGFAVASMHENPG